MAAIGTVADRLLLRPLVGLDKQQIVDIAQQRGTYDISIRDYKDCCAIQSQHPETKSFIPQLEALEEKHNLKELDQQALDELEVREFSPSGVKSK